MSPFAVLRNLSGESRAVSYAVIFGVWAEVLVYCQLHNLYLAPLAPEHFTVYHAPLWGIGNLRLLAAAWAFRASIGPGLLLGLAALFVGRTGNRPKVPVASILAGVVPCLVLVEVCGLAAGAWSWTTGEPVFPEVLYPDMKRELVTSQSIQLTCYGVGVPVAAGYLFWLRRRRTRAAGLRGA